MRRCLIISLALLAGCGREPPELSVLDLTPCPGWTGPRPETEGQFARAAAAERTGRLCANEKLETVAGAFGWQIKSDESAKIRHQKLVSAAH